VCVIDEDKPGRRLAGRLIVANLEAAQIAAGASGLDGVIVTDTTAATAVRGIAGQCRRERPCSRQDSRTGSARDF